MKINKKKIATSLSLFLSLASLNTYAHENHDPFLINVMLNKWEISEVGNNSSTSLEAQAWAGKDLNKLWMKTHIEQDQGSTEEAEVQVLYSRAVSAYWDIQTGIREDSKPSPSQTWGVVGIQGLAPYFFDLDAALFINGDGDTAARITAEYDLRFSQRLILTPEVEANFYGQDNRDTVTGAGLSDITGGLRLRYEIRREIAPYIGLTWNKKYNATANYAREQNEAVTSTQWILGLRAWY